MQIEYELEFYSLYTGEQKQVFRFLITGFIYMYMELSFNVSKFKIFLHLLLNSN
jgi:hypothetical protein